MSFKIQHLGGNNTRMTARRRGPGYAASLLAAALTSAEAMKSVSRVEYGDEDAFDAERVEQLLSAHQDAGVQVGDGEDEGVPGARGGFGMGLLTPAWSDAELEEAAVARRSESWTPALTHVVGDALAWVKHQAALPERERARAYWLCAYAAVVVGFNVLVGALVRVFGTLGALVGSPLFFRPASTSGSAVKWAHHVLLAAVLGWVRWRSIL